MAPGAGSLDSWGPLPHLRTRMVQGAGVKVGVWVAVGVEVYVGVGDGGGVRIGSEAKLPAGCAYSPHNQQNAPARSGFWMNQ